MQAAGSSLDEKVFEELSRVRARLLEELAGQPVQERREKLQRFFSVLTMEELIGLHELLELL